MTRLRAVINTPGKARWVEISDEVPEPAPEVGEAVIAVEAFSVNRGELALLKARPEGWRPGQDVAGTVVASALDGTGPSVGARVVGLVEGGGWAERVAVASNRLAALPDAVTAPEAATLPIAGRTALRTLALGGRTLGARVLVTGAAGGVGHMQTQLAVAAGARVVAVTRRATMHATLLAAGASEVVGAPTDAAGRFDVVLDGVGGRTLETAISKVAAGGTIVLYGASDPQPARLTLYDFIGRENATVRTYFSYAAPAGLQADLATLVDLLARGRLIPRLGMHTSWATLTDVLDQVAAGHVDGKAVLDVDTEPLPT